MLALLKVFVDLCKLQSAPQNLPHSQFLMMFCVGSYFLVGFAVSSLEQNLGMAMLTAGIDTGLIVGLTYLGLSIRDFGPRTVQTITALTGTGLLFELMGWPLIAFLQQLSEGESSSLSILLLVLIIWNIGVVGNILRHALEVPMWVGASIAMLYIYVTLRVMAALYIAGGVTGGVS